ncbi:hypothetical protein K0M31_009442, partial [Melipona bicolor]
SKTSDSDRINRLIRSERRFQVIGLPETFNEHWPGDSNLVRRNEHGTGNTSSRRPDGLSSERTITKAISSGIPESPSKQTIPAASMEIYSRLGNSNLTYAT